MTKIDTGLTEGDLLAELAAEIGAAHQRKPGDVDAYMLAERTGKSREICAEFLRGKVKAGELVDVTIIENGTRRKVYRKP